MSELIKLTRTPLSDADILKRLGGRTKVLVYSDFQDYVDLDSLLEPYGNVVFLLKMTDNYGHWMCVKRTGDRISFFDSYGEFPDKQKKHVPKRTLKRADRKATNYVSCCTKPVSNTPLSSQSTTTRRRMERQLHVGSGVVCSLRAVSLQTDLSNT